MARHRFARTARPGAVGDTTPADEEPAAAPTAEDAASEPVDEPSEPPEPPTATDEPPTVTAGPSAPARMAAMTSRAAVGLGAAALTRLTAARAAIRPRWTRLVLAVGGGLLLCASFPPLNWWWAAIVAAALLAWVLTHRATSPAGGFGYGALFGLALYLPLLPWISVLVGVVPWLVLAATCALFPGLFGLLAVVVRRLPGWPIWFAVLWSAQEWAKANYPFGGFPWGSVAFGQTDGPFLPLVQLGGVALLSTAIMLVGFSATAIAREIVAWWPRGDLPRAHSRGDVDRLPAVVLPGVCICVVFFAAVAVWPQVRRAGTGAGGEPLVSVAAVQGNVPRLGLGFNEQRRAVLDNHVRETLRLAEDVRAGVAPQPQFVIWPEDSSDIDPLVNADAAQQIAKAATAIHAPILVGTVLGIPGRPQDDPGYTNTVIVWNPVTGPADRHDKEIVQPFGEYLPMPWLFRHLSGYAGLAGHMVPGRRGGVVHIGGVPLGVATCWEVIFDREPRDAVLHGAQLLAVPSNNATFNKTMSEQQLAFAKVRAAEHDRYVVVAGTTGISAVIAPDGAELVRTGFFEPAYLDMQVRLKTKLTPATRWAPSLQWILVAVAGAVVLAGIRHNGWFPRPIRLRSRPVEPDVDTPPDEGGSDASQDPPPDDGGEQVPPAEGGT